MSEKPARVLADLEDEELVSLSEEWGFAPARAVLVLRYHDWVEECIGELAEGRRLAGADVDDIKQMGHEILLKAIRYFPRSAPVRHGAFERYLGWYIRCRTADQIRKLRRDAHHYEHSPAASEALREGIVPSRGRECRAARRDDPARLAEEREICDLLEKIHDELKEPERTLLEYMVKKATIRQIARKLGVSESTAKRWRDRLRDKLRPLAEGELPLFGEEGE